MDSSLSEAQRQPPTHPPRGRLRAIAMILMVGVFGITLYGLGRAQGLDDAIGGSPDEPAAIVAEQLAPSVVRIEHAGGQGSGVVFEDRLVLTAGHVVSGVSEVTVRSAGGDTSTGRVLGIDPATDIAVVRVDVDLPVADLAEGDQRVGQVAIAIGSPYGLDESVTMGIISALDRRVATEAGTLEGVIQTDAPINPGSSGGPLADRDGVVIGINHAIASTSGGNEGVGFAVPIDAALESAESILNDEVADPDEGFLPDLGFPDDGPFADLGDPRDGFPQLGDIPEELCGLRVPPFRGFEPPHVPLPRHVPEGYQTRSVATSSRDESDRAVLHEIEMRSRDDRITLTLGSAQELLDRVSELNKDDAARALQVDGDAATMVATDGRLYLIFEFDGLTGLLDAPIEIGIDVAQEIVASISW